MWDVEETEDIVMRPTFFTRASEKNWRLETVGHGAWLLSLAGVPDFKRFWKIFGGPIVAIIGKKR